jgi:arylsulfatase A-like enzyme
LSKRNNVRWFWLAAAVATMSVFVGIVYLTRLQESGGDPRPVGTVDDIPRLAERSDVNVLFILIDTLRSDRLSAYGYERETSPNLARLADGGIRFHRQLAQSSWTKCSMASLWTGLNPLNNGVTRFDDVIPDAARMPAEIFKEAGFNTVGLYRNGWVSPNFGFDQGFDVYSRPAARPPGPGVRRENPTVKAVGTDEDVIETAIEYLRVNGDERWFLYLHLMDIHEYTYDEESALFGGSYSDVYDNSIRRVDALLEVLFRYLAETGLAKKTVVVITSDHGEAFRERGVEGHARRVYRETTEVPLIVSLPFRLEPGVVVTSRSRNVDIWPTVLDMLGLDVPEERDGRSLVPTVLAAARGEDVEGSEDTGIAHLDMTWGQSSREPMPTIAVTAGPYRYVKLAQEGDAYEQLFNAAIDPRELIDQATAEPQKLVELREIGDRYLEQGPRWGEAPTRDLSEMELNQLRALGYALP